VIAQFKQTYPDVDLDLEFTDRRVDVIEEGFDAVNSKWGCADSRLTTRRLGAFRMLLSARPTILQGVERTKNYRSCAARLISSLSEYRQAPGMAAFSDGIEAEFPLPTSIAATTLKRGFFSLYPAGYRLFAGLRDRATSHRCR